MTCVKPIYDALRCNAFFAHFPADRPTWRDHIVAGMLYDLGKHDVRRDLSIFFALGAGSVSLNCIENIRTIVRRESHWQSPLLRNGRHCTRKVREIDSLSGQLAQLLALTGGSDGTIEPVIFYPVISETSWRTKWDSNWRYNSENISLRCRPNFRSRAAKWPVEKNPQKGARI